MDKEVSETPSEGREAMSDKLLIELGMAIFAVLILMIVVGYLTGAIEGDVNAMVGALQNLF
ncbi:MAG: hypothetical protein ACYCSN_19195 [Acidobacteriaceae bacterium]